MGSLGSHSALPPELIFGKFYFSCRSSGRVSDDEVANVPDYRQQLIKTTTLDEVGIGGSADQTISLSIGGCQHDHRNPKKSFGTFDHRQDFMAL